VSYIYLAAYRSKVDGSFTCILVPDRGAGKAYTLLLQGMTDANVVSIAKFVLLNKEYLAAIRPTD
jgi:non-homologous end joining protein Ku